MEVQVAADVTRLGDLYRADEAKQFLDCRRRERPVGHKPGLFLTVFEERQDAPADQVHGRFVTGDEQEERHGQELVLGELVAVLFVLVAEVLEGLTVGRGRRAIKDLLDLLPQQAVVRRAGGTQEIGAAEVQVGDVVLVKPGARVPVDGVVVAGNSFVDQAPITGESLPVEKLLGSSVYAGTINQSGVLEVRTEGVGRDTAFGKIIEAVERAEQSEYFANLDQEILAQGWHFGEAIPAPDLLRLIASKSEQQIPPQAVNQ